LGAEDGFGGFGYVLIEEVVIDASGFGIDIGWIRPIGPVHQVLGLAAVAVNDLMRR
jgi:hypothetical protein